MDHDSTDHPKPARKERRGSQPDVPPQDLIAADVDPATSAAEEDEEARLPDAPEEPADAIAARRKASASGSRPMPAPTRRCRPESCE
jgi:hypothetical protein